jgi:hypothetical protein
MEAVGYVPIRNNLSDDGLWKIDGKRQAVYAKKELSFAAQICAARDLKTRPK